MTREFHVLVRAGKWLELGDDLRELQVVVLQCEVDDYIGMLAERAIMEAGFDWKWSYRHFVTEPDENGRRFQAPFLTAFVADDGALTWTKYPGLDEVKVRDIVRSRDEGVFEGDPYALIVEEPMGGDGVLPVWDDLVQLLIRLGEIGAGVEATRRLAKKMLQVLRDAQREWELRGAMPYSLLAIVLVRSEWDHALLGRYLRTTLSTTVDLLECLGYEQNQSGMFVLTDDPDRATLRAQIEEEILHGDPRENRQWFWRAQGLDRN